MDDDEANREGEMAAEGADRFPWVSAVELATSRYAVRYLIEDAMVEGQPLIIGSPPKHCKTLVAVDASVSLATGTPFLGIMPVSEPVCVGYMSGEGGLSELQDYAGRVAAGRGIPLASIRERLGFCDTLPQLKDSHDIERLARFIHRHGVQVIVLDCLYLCMPGEDAGNVMAQGKVLRSVNKICVKAGCTPVMIHHLKRRASEPGEPAELTDLAWAGFPEFAGQWWLISRREKYAPELPGEHRLWLNIGGRAGHASLHAVDIHEGQKSDPGGRRWSVDVLRPQEARREVDVERNRARDQVRQSRRHVIREREREKIVHIMAKYPAGETQRTIATDAGISSERCGSILRELVEAGKADVVQITKGNRRTPYDGYKLAG